jgi:hypothetical protein
MIIFSIESGGKDIIIYMAFVVTTISSRYRKVKQRPFLSYLFDASVIELAAAADSELPKPGQSADSRQHTVIDVAAAREVEVSEPRTACKKTIFHDLFLCLSRACLDQTMIE